MQKTKKKSGNTQTKSSGHQNKPAITGKRIRKPLTAEQRQRKNQRDRERRALQRKLAAKANGSKSSKTQTKNGTKTAKQVAAGKRTAAQQRALTVRTTIPASADKSVTVSGFMKQLGQYVVTEVLQQFRNSGLLPVVSISDPSVPQGNVAVVAPGVTQQVVRLPNGTRIRVVTVDGEQVDPASSFSPIDPEIRHQIRLSRIARDISRIVDSHLV